MLSCGPNFNKIPTQQIKDKSYKVHRKRVFVPQKTAATISVQFCDPVWDFMSHLSQQALDMFTDVRKPGICVPFLNDQGVRVSVAMVFFPELQRQDLIAGLGKKQSILSYLQFIQEVDPLQLRVPQTSYVSFRLQEFDGMFVELAG